MKSTARNKHLIMTRLALVFAFTPTCLGWQYFTPMSDITLYESADDEEQMYHSFYTFGDCYDNPNLKLYTRVYVDHIQVLGKLIVRSWIDIPRIPTCIKLKAKSHIEYIMRDTSFNFQMCVPRITYCYAHKRIKYFFYEWYIPMQFSAGLDWEIEFFGPINDDFW